MTLGFPLFLDECLDDELVRREVQQCLQPSFKLHFKIDVSDWHQLHYSAWKWSWTHRQCSKISLPAIDWPPRSLWNGNWKLVMLENRFQVFQSIRMVCFWTYWFLYQWLQVTNYFASQRQMIAVLVNGIISSRMKIPVTRWSVFPPRIGFASRSAMYSTAAVSRTNSSSAHMLDTVLSD